MELQYIVAVGIGKMGSRDRESRRRSCSGLSRNHSNTTNTNTTNVNTNSSNSNNSRGDLPGIFSVVFNRNSTLNSGPNPSVCGGSGSGSGTPNPSSGLTLSAYHWPSFSMAGRSFWTKYCLLCTICGSAATILAGIFLVVAVLFRYYTTSIYYFETVPTYIPAILVSC